MADASTRSSEIVTARVLPTACPHLSSALMCALQQGELAKLEEKKKELTIALRTGVVVMDVCAAPPCAGRVFLTHC